MDDMVPACRCVGRYNQHMPMRADPIPDLPAVIVIGGGLAGSEAAWRLADLGIPVRLFEMRPERTSPAHHTDALAELVCSNSFKGTDPSSATGELKRELELLGSRLLAVAHETTVPAGAALAVDRARFSARVMTALQDHPLVDIQRAEMSEVPEEAPCIIATGPLTSDALESALSRLVGDTRLAFFDAAAPIVDATSIDRSATFVASRYDKGDSADYLNCPLTQDEYEALREGLASAARVTLKDFERGELFSACQPIEEIARSGTDAMRFGSLKPVGLVDPTTGARPYAVVQLRAENHERTAYNLVGFQTNLTFPEQRRVLALIPALAHAEFLRYGVMHRNTFIDAPRVLDPTLRVRSTRAVRIAGQLAGTEGYLEAIATGTLAALNTAADLLGHAPVVLPHTSALGSLIAYATSEETTGYQPMHVNWGLVPPLERRTRGKRERYAAYGTRAFDDARGVRELAPSDVAGWLPWLTHTRTSMHF